MPLFDGVPIAPAVGGTATDVEMLLDPERESPVLILCQIITGTLGAEFVPEPIEHRSQVLLGKFLVLFPRGYDCRSSSERYPLSVGKKMLGPKWNIVALTETTNWASLAVLRLAI